MTWSPPEKISNLLTRTETLSNLGPQEQARWVRVKEFETVPSRLRIDNVWISKAKPADVLDVAIELQPILNRLEGICPFF